MTIELRRRTWTVGEYHRMVDAGLLREDDRVELIEGEIVEMSPIGGPHIAWVNRLNALLVPPAAGRAIVQVQMPVVLSERSEPEPDVSVLRWREDFYREKARPADVLLLVEVADSSLRFDEGVKLPLYARSGIPETWIVDVAAGVVRVYDRPEAGRYTRRSQAGGGDALAVPGLEGVAVEVSDFLG